MDNLIEPNLHPVFVHFVVGLLFSGALVLAVAAFVPGAARWRSAMLAGGDWMLALGLLAAVGALVAGFQAYYTVAHDAASHAAMTTHRNWALVTASVFAALGAWRWMIRHDGPGPLFAAAALAAAALLAVTAWWGGVVVFEHGVGVQSLPAASGEGHDHAHGEGGHGDSHDEASAAQQDGHEHAAPSGEGRDGHSQEGVHAPETGSAGTPEAAADAFHAALAGSHEAQVRALLSGDVLILESGGAERSLEQYASHHMMADMAFLSNVESERLSRTSKVHGDAAWVATESALRGTHQGREIAVKAQETLVLRRRGEGWVIEHVHWSNSPLGEDEVAQEVPAAEEHDHGDHEH
ncbi:DUF2231 domain-containing protein [Marinicauda algicola]|uniref:DUF2231 domain-containing protein n=1 Tax=Marinicauda algicola TaxID=2029849 RepID=A0A4S2GZS9_9PROT|nr:DUF2231 domain-containing protein [Marinicauda algicola]TGY88441.1 DUF2231 domain-containing protein [Marinicauda algicola]